MRFLSKHIQKPHFQKEKSRFLQRRLLNRRKSRASVEQRPAPRLPAGVYALWLLFLAALFYITFFSEFFLIAEPRIFGANEVSEETLSRFVKEQFSGKYFDVFPRRNFFLARPRHLEEDLLKEYPLLASASVTRVFPDGLRVEVTERKKIILWCSGGSSSNAMDSDVPGEQCFLIDEAGKAQDSSRALLPENLAYVIFVTDMSGKPVSIGEQVFDPSYGLQVVQLKEMFEERLGIPLSSHLTTASRVANEIRVKTTEGWEAYFGTDVPLESSLNALQLLFAKELPLEKRTRLAYVDLRTENRAYFAFRAEENAEKQEAIISPAPEEKVSDTKVKQKKKK